MARLKSALVMILRFLRDFWAAVIDFLINTSAAPEGIPRLFAWIFRSDSVDFKNFSSRIFSLVIRANLSR